ncbi:hypothetical protein [Celeribacter halophilus]|uniref:hypothetical protein n=1 Tax=Celeribacter halophilus TaxID=576117 RepID=UPI002FD206A2
MKHDLALEKKLLLLVEEGGADARKYDLVFPEVLADFPEWKKYSPDKDVFWKILQYHTELLVNSGCIHEQPVGNQASILKLTMSGHERIKWHRENTVARRILRWIQGFVDGALKSVLTPIIVSVVTVCVLNYLGLNQ